MSKEIRLAGHLEGLVLSCQKFCNPECCGKKSFDFSPIHFASIISVGGEIQKTQLKEILSELDCLIKFASTKFESEDDYVYITSVKDSFTKLELEEFVNEIRETLKLVPQILQFSESLIKKS